MGDAGEGERQISTKTGLSDMISMLDRSGTEVADVSLRGSVDASDLLTISQDTDGRSVFAVDDGHDATACATGGEGCVDVKFKVETAAGDFRTAIESKFFITDKTAVIATHSSPGLEIERLRSPMYVDAVARSATARVNFNDIGSKIRVVKGLGEDMLIIPQSGSVDVTCTSGAGAGDDQCFAGRKDHVTDGIAELAPVNMQLINALNEQTTLIDKLTETVAFASALVDGTTHTDPVNFLALAPAGTSMDGDGVDNILCGSQLMGNGVVNTLVRYIMGGQQMCTDEAGVTEENNVVLHIIDQAKRGDCDGKGSCKLPLENVEVKVFDRTDSAFESQFGSNPKGSEYADVFEADVGLITNCYTDATGNCSTSESAAGEYLVVVKYIDTESESTVYTGSPKDSSDFVDGVAVKDFQIIKVIKKNGSIQFSGGKKTVVTGSQLDIVYPLDAIWDEGTQDYIYPFIFVSDDNWEVDVCGQVPQGYEIVGVYDENGNLVTADDCYETFVVGETKVVAFEVVMVGSPPEWAMNVKLKVKHNGKLQHVNIGIPTHVWEHAQGKPFQDGEFVPPGSENGNGDPNGQPLQ